MNDVSFFVCFSFATIRFIFNHILVEARTRKKGLHLRQRILGHFLEPLNETEIAIAEIHPLLNSITFSTESNG